VTLSAGRGCLLLCVSWPPLHAALWWWWLPLRRVVVVVEGVVARLVGMARMVLLVLV
jgi:hypothetical protein